MVAVSHSDSVLRTPALRRQRAVAARPGGGAARRASRSRRAPVSGRGLEPDVRARRRGRAGANPRPSAGANLVVAVGGDGTINEVVNGILTAGGRPPGPEPGAGRDAPFGEGPTLGILPAGSGSDFARSLAIPRDVDGALAVIAAGRRRRIDAGRIVCAPLDAGVASPAIERFFINMGGCGASAQVASRFNRRRIPGALGYAVASGVDHAELPVAAGRDPDGRGRGAHGDAQHALRLQRRVLRRRDARRPRFESGRRAAPGRGGGRNRASQDDAGVAAPVRRPPRARPRRARDVCAPHRRRLDRRMCWSIAMAR